MSIKYFDSVSEDWDTMRKSFFPDAVREISIREAGITTGSTIADIGAGSGFITESLVKLPISIIAIDQSPGMIRIMEEKFSDHKNIKYIRTHSDQIPLPDKHVDAALANMYLHHVNDPAFAINELFRILKLGGRLIITDLDEHNDDFLINEHHDRWKGFNREDIRLWFIKAGFKNITVSCLGETCQSISDYGEDMANISIFIATGEK